MINSKHVKYSKGYRNIMNDNRRKRNLRDSTRKVSDSFLRETKYKYIPVKTGALMRSTIYRMNLFLNKVVTEFSSNVPYAEWVWDHAKIPYKRHWFEKVANVKRNISKWENMLKEGFFK